MTRIRVLHSHVMRALIPALAILVAVSLLYMLVPGVRDLPWTPVRTIGAIVAVAGYVLVCVARIQLGSAFTVKPKATKLVTYGLYSRFRNPIYVFVDLMLSGLILVFDFPWLLIALAVLATGQTLQARREAAVLEQKFGQEYRDYRRRTWF